MLEYVKIILEKVSFDQKLFEKELKKGIKQLVPNEIKLLRDWCYTKFGKVYHSILNKIFNRMQLT
ncbi:hypothetical protein LAG90_14085 [Marinilongibacter aquaticus]|uniref:hypothetical protein n=1 Tax=Marinilongibacter aquaticus TaxID=2975157 RepID=UPI0021BDD59B|nr:hypothetical protein [Marinilongibacter aquaticus]UBM57934.1 hypothetical protein LAG90_14085 [Marinilongibacter aquaticus]